MRKPWKTITQDNGTISIYGNHHWIDIDYQQPDWSENEEPCFQYKGNTVFLDEVMNIHNKIHNPNPIEWMKEFDGYTNDSFFSGLLIKLDEDGEKVQVFTFIS